MGDLKKEYPGLYSRAEYLLRLDGIPRDNNPGFELLRKSILIAKVYGRLPADIFLDKLKEGGTIVPNNKDLIKERDLALQWMIEALEVADIIPLDHNEDVELLLYHYIREIANKL